MLYVYLLRHRESNEKPLTGIRQKTTMKNI